MRTHQELIVWQKGIDLVTDVYVLTKAFPDEERFNLTSQMRRCAVSIPSNIAEGHGRKTNGDFARFLAMAYGSSAELETQLLISKRLKLVSEKDYDAMIVALTEIQKMLNKLISSTRS